MRSTIKNCISFNSQKQPVLVAFSYIYSMDIQEILAFLALGIALAFLIKKFFIKKKKSDKNCGSGDCGCS